MVAVIAAATSLKAQQVTISLMSGWNWISYPCVDTVDITTAFGTFGPEEGDMIQSQFAIAEWDDGEWFGDFERFYPGYGYMYYSNRTMPVFLTFNVQQPAPQMVATAMPYGITATSAVAGGMVNLPEGTHVFLRGVCWGTNFNPDIDGDHTSEGTGIGRFSCRLEGLNPNTTYYVRAYSVSDYGLAYGKVLIFTTLSGIPEVITSEVTDITGDGAICGGIVVDGGGLDVTARGVCWGTDSNPDIDGDHTSEGTGTGSFSSTMTNLTSGTTYYVRAYATTAQATSYGDEMTFTTLSGIPEVITSEVTGITATTATGGGTVTTDGGLTVTARGVCWGTNHNPTLSDSHTTDGTGTGSFSSALESLNPNTTYYVRAYASNSYVTIYGSEVSFTTEAGGNSGDHNYVDLGLPSGLLWATCNIGADAPEDYGDYFAWGETQPKDTYNWSTYQYCNGSNNTLTKYCNKSTYGYNGFTDNLTTLLPEDDAATANWGNDWRMPTKAEWQELYNHTICTRTTQNGVNGRLFTASNGNSLFVPAAGFRNGSSLSLAGSYGSYRSSSLFTSTPYNEWFFFFNSTDYYMYMGNRSYGFTVRPVCSSRQN